MIKGDGLVRHVRPRVLREMLRWSQEGMRPVRVMLVKDKRDRKQDLAGIEPRSTGPVPPHSHWRGAREEPDSCWKALVRGHPLTGRLRSCFLKGNSRDISKVTGFAGTIIARVRKPNPFFFPSGEIRAVTGKQTRAAEFAWCQRRAPQCGSAPNPLSTQAALSEFPRLCLHPACPY